MRNQLGEELNNHSRTDFKEWVNVNLSNQFLLQPHISYYNSQNLADQLNYIDIDEGVYGSVVLGYKLDRTEIPVLRHFELLYAQ